MSKRKMIRRQTMADKILHTKLKIEQHQPSFGPWDQEWEVVPFPLMTQAVLLSLRQTYFCNQSFLCRCAIQTIKSKPEIFS